MKKNIWLLRWYSALVFSVALSGLLAEPAVASPRPSPQTGEGEAVELKNLFPSGTQWRGVAIARYPGSQSMGDCSEEQSSACTLSGVEPEGSLPSRAQAVDLCSCEHNLPWIMARLENFPAPTREAFYKNVEKTYTFFKDGGSCEIRTKSLLHIETLFAMNELCGETFIVYNPRFQKVRINEAYTTTKDGKRIDVPENALNEVLPAVVANAPDFNFLREIVITHTALEPGAEIYLDYSIFYDTTTGIIFDEEAELQFPCDSLVFDFNGATTEEINVPARSREAFFFSHKKVPVVYPGMEFEEIDIYSDKGEKLSDGGEKIFSTIAPADKSTEERILAAQKFVQEKIATVKISPELLDFELRDPDTVLLSGYGIPVEKARLLRLLLKNIAPEDQWDISRDYEHEAFFVLRHKESGEQGLFDVEARSGWANGLCVSGDVEITPLKQTFRGKISQKNMTPQFAADSDFEPKKFLTDSLGAKEDETKDATVSKDPEGANTLEFEFSRDEIISNTVFFWKLPVSPKGLASSGWDKLPLERESEFTVSKHGGNAEISESYEFRISPKEGVSFEGEPVERVVVNEFGETHFSVKKDGDVIVVEKSLHFALPGKFPAGKFAPKDYPKFRELMQEWFSPRNSRLLFHAVLPEDK